MGREQMLPSFLELRKLSRQGMPEKKEYRLALMGNVSTQHMADAIRGYGAYEQLRLNVFDADYDQIEEQLRNSHSEAYQFHPDAFFLFLSSERLYEDFTNGSAGANFADDLFDKISGWWDRIEQLSGGIVLQNTIMEADDGVYGSYGSRLEQSFIYQTRKLNYLIMCGAEKRKDIFLVDFAGLQREYGRRRLFDSKMYYMGKLVISTEYLPLFAKAVVDIIKSIAGRNKKCVILDLDNTLWGGIVSETGVRGIEIGNLGKGHAFTDFQIWLRELKRRGILLAVCSKNDESAAKAPFLEHPEMILRLDDFAVFVANWNDKAENIKEIQRSLNIGMDSMVFLDDNPFERELVRTMLPEVTVPELPADPADYLSYLKSLNLFETTAYSGEDAERTKQYQTEEKRKNLRDSAGSYEAYLESLQMTADIRLFDEFQVPRISQLCNRSNQFNLRTVRYSEKEIENIIKDPEQIGLYVTLKDKFGDYGLVSVIILKRSAADELFIDTWLMSCRVLKRGLESFIINYLADLAGKEKITCLVGEYIETPKNQMVRDLYKTLGFCPDVKGLWRLPVEQYEQIENYISRKEQGDSEWTGNRS